MRSNCELLQAIDLMDEAGSRARIEAYMARVPTGGNAPPQRQPWQELAQVMQAKTEAVKVSNALCHAQCITCRSAWNLAHSSAGIAVHNALEC